MPRPPKITDEMLREIEELAADGTTIPSIEALIGVSDGLLRHYWAKGSNQKGIGLKVFHALKKGYARFEQTCLQIIWAAAYGHKHPQGEYQPQWTAAMRMLEARFPEWARIEKTMQIEPVNIVISKKLLPKNEDND